METPISARTAPGAAMSTARFFSSGNVSDLKSMPPAAAGNEMQAAPASAVRMAQSFVFMGIPGCGGTQGIERKFHMPRIISLL